MGEHVFYWNHLLSFICTAGFLVPFFIYMKNKSMDKVKHYALSAVMTFVVLTLINVADFKLPWWTAPLIVLGIGTIKEIIDKINPKKKLFDFGDIIADALGIGLVTSIYICSFLLMKFVE